MRIAVLGAGSLGSVVGAHLARAGQDVILIGRQAHVERLRDDGLRVTGLEDFTVKVGATADPADVEKADLLLLTTKTYDSVAALEDSHFEVEMAASLQNGVTKDEVLAGKYGREKVLGALTGIGASMAEPGVVAHTYNGATLFGEFSGETTERCVQVVEAFKGSGLEAEISGRIMDDEWSKLCQYCAGSMVSSLSRLEYHRMCKSPSLAELFVTISREVEAVARALGYRLRNVASFRVEDVLRRPFEEAVESVMERGRALERAGMINVKISMLQDLEAGRRTELEETVGYVVRKAEELGVDVPSLSLAYLVVKGIEEGLV